MRKNCRVIAPERINRSFSLHKTQQLKPGPGQQQ